MKGNDREKERKSKKNEKNKREKEPSLNELMKEEGNGKWEMEYVLDQRVSLSACSLRCSVTNGGTLGCERHNCCASWKGNDREKGRQRKKRGKQEIDNIERM